MSIRKKVWEILQNSKNENEFLEALEILVVQSNISQQEIDELIIYIQENIAFINFVYGSDIKIDIERMKV